MGLFSSIFGTNTKTTFDTQLGLFVLVFSKRNKNIWKLNSNGLVISVRGTDKEPDEIQIRFLENLSEEVQKIDDKITSRFTKEFADADLEGTFTNWKQRFKIVAIEIMATIQDQTYWNITFEDLEEPFAQFTLYIEGLDITDFSIDT
jgi:hypothetical protein